MESIAAVRERVPLVMSGDLHAVAIGRMMRSGKLDFAANPINAVLTGPISTRPSGWPSARRGTGALPPAHLDMAEDVKPIEQHGFTIVDFAPDKIVLQTQGLAGIVIGVDIAVNYHVTIPTSARLRVRAVDGDVTVADVDGQVVLSSMNGQVIGKNQPASSATRHSRSKPSSSCHRAWIRLRSPSGPKEEPSEGSPRLRTLFP